MENSGVVLSLSFSSSNSGSVLWTHWASLPVFSSYYIAVCV